MHWRVAGDNELFHLAPPMIPGFGFSHIHKDGVSVPDPGNPSILLTMVGTWSEDDPLWEVRTLP
jgi:hypothetical protein